MSNYSVAKFGGSSLATANRIINAAKIIKSDTNRRYIVVSAPGKKTKDDIKITDLLIKCAQLSHQNKSFKEVFKLIEDRYREIALELNCEGIEEWLLELREGIEMEKEHAWVVSRGEWLMAQLFAQYLGANFVDAASIIQIKKNGTLDPVSEGLIKKRLSNNGLYVIPGFYGRSEDDSIRIFPRGGSDITGAIIAKAVHAKTYENWTDVDGVYTAQPTLVDNAKLLDSLTFREMRELGYRGAEVLQHDALLPLIEIGIPIHVKNAFRPEAAGTLITLQRTVSEDELIIGIAGRGGFTTIQIQKYGLNDQKGIIEKITHVLKTHNVSFEHNPTGLDYVSIIVAKDAIRKKEDKILESLKKSIKPDHLSIKHNNLALICLVGEGLAKNPLAHTKAAALMFQKLAQEKIQIHAIISATAGIDIVVAIGENNLKTAIRTLHNAFFK